MEAANAYLLCHINLIFIKCSVELLDSENSGVLLLMYFEKYQYSKPLWKNWHNPSPKILI